MIIFDIALGKDLVVYARNSEVLVFHYQPSSLQLVGPLFRYDANHYVNQVKFIDIPNVSRRLLCAQVGKRVEYAWLELPSLKSAAQHQLFVNFKMSCLIELENSDNINFIYIPFDNRLAVFGDEDIFVTESLVSEAGKEPQLKLRKTSIPMQTEVGALANYITPGSENTTSVCTAYESRFKAWKSVAQMGKNVLMTRIGKRFHCTFRKFSWY